MTVRVARRRAGRTGEEIRGRGRFGHRAAGPSLLCESYEERTGELLDFASGLRLRIAPV